MLVADGQSLFAHALGRLLARQPELEVLQPYLRAGAETARAAVRRRPDVALLDLWLEGVTGLAATRSIAAKAPETQVLVLGWFHGAAEMAQALDAGAAGFVSKELCLPDLVEAVKLVGAGERVVIDPSFRVAVDAGATSSPGGDAHEGPGEAFTPRELEVIRLLGAGLPLEDIAARLGLAPNTARTHLTRVLAKTGTSSQLQAITLIREWGFLI